MDPEKEDESDAADFYRCMEDEIIPLYYKRDRDGVPHEWTRVVKNSIRSVTPAFSTRRMLKEYAERIYIPAAKSHRAQSGSRACR